MTTALSVLQPTLLDITRKLDPDGSQATIAEILTKQNPVLEDMTWKEGNLITGERATVRNSLPTASFRRLNAGVARSKSTTRQFDDAAANLESFSMVDRELAILSGDVARYRAAESGPYMEGMNQKMATTVFYGNTTTAPDEFTGLAPRFNSLSGSTGGQIIDGGGVGTDNRSIWVINWDPMYVTGIFPKNTKGGLFHDDVTSNTSSGADGFPVGDVVLDADGNPYMAYQDHWQWRCGIHVRDPRHVIRVANIDYSALTTDASSGAKLQTLLVQAMEQMETIGPRCTIYMPRKLRTYLRLQLLSAKNAYLSWEDMAGKKVLAFDGVAIKRTDALNVDEARVT